MITCNKMIIYFIGYATQCHLTVCVFTFKITSVPDLEKLWQRGEPQFNTLFEPNTGASMLSNNNISDTKTNDVVNM